jgi:hypothetical protein
MSWRDKLLKLNWQKNPRQRKTFEGQLIVYREPFEEFLRAKVKLDDGTELYYYKAPLQFENVVTAESNRCRISFVAYENGSYPRNVKRID